MSLKKKLRKVNYAVQDVFVSKSDDLCWVDIFVLVYHKSASVNSYSNTIIGQSNVLDKMVKAI